MQRDMVETVLAIGTGHDAHVTASLFAVVRALRAAYPHLNTAQVLAGCLKVLAHGQDEGPFEYFKQDDTVRVHVLDRACLRLARKACPTRVRTTLAGVVKRVYALRETGRFAVPSAQRSGAAIEIRQRVGGTKDGKLDWYLIVDGVPGKALRSFPEIDVKV